MGVYRKNEFLIIIYYKILAFKFQPQNNSFLNQSYKKKQVFIELLPDYYFKHKLFFFSFSLDIAVICYCFPAAQKAGFSALFICQPNNNYAQPCNSFKETIVKVHNSFKSVIVGLFYSSQKKPTNDPVFAVKLCKMKIFNSTAV